MATTRLMPLHTGKGRTVGQAISGVIDYTENPQKRTAQADYELAMRQPDRRRRVSFTKNQYIQSRRVRGEDDVIAYI